MAHPFSAVPRCGCRKNRRGRHSSSGRVKSPKGPLELMKPPRSRVKGNRPRGLETVSPGGKGNLSSLGPPRTSNPTRRRPWEASSYLPSLSLPGSLLNIWCRPCALLGLVKSVLVPLPTPGRLRTKEPGLYGAQEMEAL